MIVTITGADDSVDVSELAKLSREFPFVEWAILISASRGGTTRYPSAAWLAALHLVARLRQKSGEQLLLAAHLCGSVARQWWQDGRSSYLSPLFQRIQINGYDVGFEGKLAELADREGRRFILQARSAESFSDCCADAIAISHGATVLYDPSGGAGKRAAWPKRLRSYGVDFGIAGGIGPDNIAEAVNVAVQLGARWIDMESGVRDERDHFDLGRVRSVLETVAALFKVTL